MFGPIKKHARLLQWNGRQRSSRTEDPVLPRLWQRPVLQRLAMVLAATSAVTLVVFSCGLPFPYRVGEVYPSDLRVRVNFELINQPQSEWKREEALERFPEDETRDLATREEIRRGVQPIVEKYPPGMPLVKRGQPITERQLTL